MVAGVARQGLDCEFGAFQLVDGFDAALQRIHRGHPLIGGDGRVEVQQQRVAMVFDVGDHPLISAGASPCTFLARSASLPSVPRGCPARTRDVLVLAAAQADVHAADQRGVAVGHGAETRPALGDAAGELSGSNPVRHKPDRRDDLVPGALAFFLVGADPVAAAGLDGQQPHHVGHRAFQREGARQCWQRSGSVDSWR